MKRLLLNCDVEFLRYFEHLKQNMWLAHGFITRHMSMVFSKLPPAARQPKEDDAEILLERVEVPWVMTPAAEWEWESALV